jgi:2-oxoglutarate ferredoxin oxidoreductase subunit gamma
VPKRSADVAVQRLEVRFTGSGGQGIVLAATVMADAACSAGFEVLQTISYGPEARGGASRAEVIVAREEIDYPQMDTPDVTLCLSQAAYDKFAPRTRAGGTLIYDSGLVEPHGANGKVRLVGAPCTQLARDTAGTPMAANMVVLGVLEHAVPFVGYEALEDGMRSHLPAKHLAANLKALRAGFELEL